MDTDQQSGNRHLPIGVNRRNLRFNVLVFLGTGKVAADKHTRALTMDNPSPSKAAAYGRKRLCGLD